VQDHYGSPYRIYCGYEAPVLGPIKLLGPIKPRDLSNEHDAHEFIIRLRLDHAFCLKILQAVGGLMANSDISLAYGQRDLARVSWGWCRQICFYQLDPFACDFGNIRNNHYPVIRPAHDTASRGMAYHFVPATILLMSDPNPADVTFFGLDEWSQASEFLDSLALTDAQLAMMIEELKLRAWPNRADRLKSLLMALTRGDVVIVRIYDDITPPRRKGPEDLPVEYYTPEPYTLGPHEEPGYEPPPRISKAENPHSGLHNRDELTPDFTTSADSFKTARVVDMRNLSPEEVVARKVFKNQGWNEDKIEEILTSGDQFNLKEMTKGDRLYSFTTAGRNNSVLKDKAYWLDSDSLADVESEFFRKGHWDREGVKGYLALPCFNRANEMITVELTEDQTVVKSTIGKATELLRYDGIDGYTTGIMSKTMNGGGIQIAPNARKLILIPGK